jgi:16S rRNA (cytosine1402-N4)-methyltransferase
MDHVPVMVREVTRYLLHERSRLVLDGTLGCGGHSQAILAANPGVSIIGVDPDGQALRCAEQTLEMYGDRVRFVRGSYADLSSAVAPGEKLDGALLDLGVSSLQIDEPARGFSYLNDGPLDMRMSASGPTAAEFIDTTSETELFRMLKHFGEVTRPGRIARSIKNASAEGRLSTTGELKQAVNDALRGNAAPALLSKVFQAIRIALNGELENIKRFTESILDHTNADARLVFISYHSLEDSLVKEFLRREGSGCLCPASTPVCVCGHEPSVDVLTRRVVKPSPGEISSNPRARSAKLRAARVLKIGGSP